MNILTLNLDLKLFKFELFDSKDLSSLNKGEFEIEINETGNNQEVIDKLFRQMLRQVGDVSQIKCVGHKIIFGNDEYSETQKITAQEIYELEKLNDLVPNNNLAGIKSSNKYIPDVPDYAVFDTAFFKDLPEQSKIYPIPYKFYEELNVYKSGCDGIAHKFAGEQASEKLKLPFDKAKLVSVYLDDNCSVCAIDKGKPIDISCIMSQTYAGDIDSKAIIRILRITTDFTDQNIIKELDNILNSQSGIKGISNQDDYLELIKAVNFGDAKAKLTFEVFVNKVKKSIGAHMAILGQVNAIVFTGKISTGKIVTKKKICDKMNILEGIAVHIVETQEELAIAREIKKVIRK